MRQALRSRGIPTTDHFLGDAGGDAYWTLARWTQALRSIPEGITELMCHPGYTPSHLTSGYSAQREVELATFVSPEAHAALTSSGVTLVDFSALA
jgi:predicted glycoside hydrolase/deacetylase ChbG (UPF0249 family)